MPGDSAELWRSWSENAPQVLLDDFQPRSFAIMKEVRRKYGPTCGPSDPSYLNMRFEMHTQLNALCQQLQGEYDAEH